MRKHFIKRAVSIMIAAALAFSLFACSEESDEVKKVSEDADVTMEAESEDAESTSPDMTEISEESESETEEETKKSVAKTKTAESKKKTDKSTTEAEDETEEETTVAEGEVADDEPAKETSAASNGNGSAENVTAKEETVASTKTPTYAETTAAVTEIQETTTVAATTVAEEVLDPMFDFNVTLPYSERIPLFDAAAASYEFMRLWNERRASLGLQPIATVYDTTNYDAIDSRIYQSCAAEIAQDIQESAKIRAEEIHVYYSHQRPNGLTWADFANQGLDVAQFNCECITGGNGSWYNTNNAVYAAKQAFNSFMNSDAHRNLMDNPEMSIGACWFCVYYVHTDVNDAGITDAMREARSHRGNESDPEDPVTLESWNDFAFTIAVEFQPL